MYEDSTIMYEGQYSGVLILDTISFFDPLESKVKYKVVQINRKEGEWKEYNSSGELLAIYKYNKFGEVEKETRFPLIHDNQKLQFPLK